MRGTKGERVLDFVITVALVLTLLLSVRFTYKVNQAIKYVKQHCEVCK